MRLRKNPNAKDKLENSIFLINEFPFNTTNYFVELGMGKGKMIVELARDNPNKLYLGIEKYPTVALKAMNLATKYNLNNFKIIVGDISNLDSLIVGQPTEIYLTFSDPWPKNRHEKRRLTYEKFLKMYKSLLNGNKLKLKTDNDKLFSYSIDSITNFGGVILYKTHDLHTSKYSKNNVMTHYEIKWSEKGKNINYLEAKL